MSTDILKADSAALDRLAAEGKRRMYLIAEYCGHDIYMGWHLYLRDNNKRQQRNADGTWGWIQGVGRRGWEHHSAKEILDQLGITIQGDGTCDYDGIAEITRRFPIPRQRIWKKPRGCIAVDVGDYGIMTLATATPLAKTQAAVQTILQAKGE